MTASAELTRKCQQYRLSLAEYEMMKDRLQREPQGVEWALFSALWSEHCSYKSSKVHLRKFKYKNSRVLESEGENAGVLDLGQGEKIAFKMESHNHPSFIEPFQGAATGVGGILRDIFTMGARPIALADYLCFGQPSADRMPKIIKGVVHGISSYGNCVGVPTVTGQTEYQSEYDKNVLVNAMAVGLFTDKMPIAKSKASGPGNLVVYVGAKTGKDGVHGASMASESFGANSEAKKPNVQIGDPFYEKLLIEACLEIIQENLVVAMQDMGAAGLTSSSFEMSAKGGVGLRLDLSLVPLRDQSMSPEDILLSESQERMLLVCEPKKLKRIQEIFSRWGLDSVSIGEVLKEPVVQIFWKGEKLTEIDPRVIVDQAPVYERAYSAVSEQPSTDVLKTTETGISEFLKQYTSSMQGQSREWITSQYDQRVGLRTARDASQSISVMRLPSGRGLSLAVGCRPEVMKANSRLGALDSVFYPSLQMALKGAKVLGITDCLNFGNPEKNHVMSDFVTSVESIAEASRLLDAPVVSGNVSFYNETMGQNIIPTPATGLVGLRDHVQAIPWDQFQNPDEIVFWIRQDLARLDQFTGQWFGELQPGNWTESIQWILNSSKLFKSSKAVGKGGLWATLWNMSKKGIGLKHNFFFDLISQVQVDVPVEECVTVPFYESVVSLKAEDLDTFRQLVMGAPPFIRVFEVGRTQKQFIDWKNERVTV